MNSILDVKLLTTLEPLSLLSAARMRELLDSCELQEVAQGENPFELVSLHGQSVYLLRGELELEYQDANRVLVSAMSEWAKHPLGKRQPQIKQAIALSSVQLLRIEDSVLDMMLTWDQFTQQDNKNARIERSAALNMGLRNHLLRASLFSLEYLKNGPFACLPSANIGQLLDRMEAISVAANEVVVKEGDAGDYYYIIESGRARVTRMVGGVSVLLAELKAGDAFGEEALISGAMRNASVMMKNNGVLLRLKQQDFIELMQEPLLHRLSYAEAKLKVAQGATWVDVRYPPEYRYDRLSGAINVPLAEIRSAVGAFNKARTYILYCQSGRRSLAAAFILAQAGYDIYVLEGGLWGVLKSQQQ
jgi:rhodanese-related sulfurtransferase